MVFGDRDKIYIGNISRGNLVLFVRRRVRRVVLVLAPATLLASAANRDRTTRGLRELRIRQLCGLDSRSRPAERLGVPAALDVIGDPPGGLGANPVSFDLHEKPLSTGAK